MTEELFREDAALLSCEAVVLAVDEMPEGALVVLDRTVFYPLGGGQAGDAGALQRPDGRVWAVVDTRKHKERPGAIAHVLAAGARFNLRTRLAIATASATSPHDALNAALGDILVTAE